MPLRGPTIYRRINRPDPELSRSFAGISSATVHESLPKGGTNVMHHSLKPVRLGMKVSGPAVTVESALADNLTVHVALTLCQPGDVLVVDAHGTAGVMFGAQMAYQAMRHGIAGIVVDGAVRDTEEIGRMGFPTFASLVSPLGSSKSTPGSVNVPVKCGGVLVTPGDIVVGDDDGVVVVPRAAAAGVLVRARARAEKEEKTRALYDQGKTSMELNGYDRLLEEKNISILDGPEG